LRELTYLPKGEMDPHTVDPSDPRMGIDWLIKK